MRETAKSPRHRWPAVIDSHVTSCTETSPASFWPSRRTPSCRPMRRKRGCSWVPSRSPLLHRREVQAGLRTVSPVKTSSVPGASVLCGRAAAHPPHTRCKSSAGAKCSSTHRRPCSGSRQQQTFVLDSDVLRRREVGATLHVVAADGESDSHNSALQWLRQVAGLTELEIIAGAVRSQARRPGIGACPPGLVAKMHSAVTVCACLLSRCNSWLIVTSDIIFARSTRRSPRTEAAGSPCAATAQRVRPR